MEQSITPDEIIVCDDNSTDETINILSEYKRKWPNIFKIYQNENRIGYIKNFEQATKIASGDVIALCDQDDIWEKEKLKKQLKIVSEPNIGLVYHNSMMVDIALEPFNDLWSSLNPPYHPNNSHDSLEIFSELLVRNFVQGATIMFDSEFKEILYPFPAKIPHDYYMAIVFSLITNIKSIDEKLLLYRQHEDQVIGGKSIKRGYNYINDIKKLITVNRNKQYQDYERWNCLRNAILGIDPSEFNIKREIVIDKIDKRKEFSYNRYCIYKEDFDPIRKYTKFNENIRNELYSQYGTGKQMILKDFMGIWFGHFMAVN